MSRRVPIRPGREEGMALLLALLFVTLLSVIVVEYCYETQVDAALATNDASDFEAYVAARSAIASGLANGVGVQAMHSRLPQPGPDSSSVAIENNVGAFTHFAARVIVLELSSANQQKGIRFEDQQDNTSSELPRRRRSR